MSFSQFGNHIPRCQHIKTNGTQCGSPALRRRRFCYFHHRWRATHLDLNNAGALRVTTHVELPVLEDADSIQVALMQVMRLILCRQLDHKTGGLLLYGLQTASINLRNVDFEHRRKTSVVIEPSRVRENGFGDEAWSPEDFAEEDSVEDEAQEEQQEAQEEAATMEEIPVEPAAQRQKNEAHGVSHGLTAKTDQAPEERKKEARKEEARKKDGQKKEGRQREGQCPAAQLEAQFESALEGAQQGNWRDLKTVFELAGIYPENADSVS